jgi:hypothetical protein
MASRGRASFLRRRHRAVLREVVVDHVSVTGSHNSTSPSTFGRLHPPAARTLPLLMSVTEPR